MRPLVPVALFALVSWSCTAPTVAPDAGALDATVPDATLADAPSPDVLRSDPPADSPADSPARDTGPHPASTAHCTYTPLAATANAGTAVVARPLRAGAASTFLDVPIGATLGGYAGRSSLMADTTSVDARTGTLAGSSFVPSVGIETIPRAQALVLSTDDDVLVLTHVDLVLSTDDLPFDLAARLGPAYAGKVVVTTSHSHASFGHFTPDPVLAVGLGRFRSLVYTRVLDALERAVRSALAARVPARYGIAHDAAFDPTDSVSRDRRTRNDDLPGGARRKDHDLFVLRVDTTDGDPIAVVPVFGVHGTVNGADNLLVSTEASGAIERAVEEHFDRSVVVMHLQGAAGDVSPAGDGGIDCTGVAHCPEFARTESVGRNARDSIVAAWQSAGTTMRDTLALSVATREIALGPDWTTFTVRDGGLAYAPFDRAGTVDGLVFDDAGRVRSPIDEFRAPSGAALCGSDNDALLSPSQLPGTRGVTTYRSCLDIARTAPVLFPAIDVPVEPTPVCATTRTTISAARLDDTLFAILPGEPVNLLADRLRAGSPVAPDQTIVLGYAQGHVGYLLTADDWLRGGYEPSINVWGPLEAETVVERELELLRFVQQPMRSDATVAGTTRFASPGSNDTDLPAPDPAPLAGTVPDTLPASLYVATGTSPTSAQPAATVPRLARATFTWIGEDPLSGTPRVTLQREGAPGTFLNVLRRSGRAVQDGEVLLTYTPAPLVRVAGTARIHYWTAAFETIAPWGTDDGDDLARRASLATGRYRFHVAGSTYTVDSAPFTVGVAVLGVRVESTRVTVTADAPDGWRLRDTSVSSNRAVPLRGARVHLVVRDDTNADSAMDATLDADGSVLLPAGAHAIRRVTVTDAFGNVGVVAL